MASSVADRVGGVPAGRGTLRRPRVRWRRVAEYLSFAPFAAFVIVFLLWPAYIVVTGAFVDEEGRVSADAVLAIVTLPVFVDAFVASIRLSAITAVAGAVLGALLSWAVSAGSRAGWLRRGVLAACGVLAQFGGVMLAFAFLATFGLNGLATLLLAQLAPDSLLAQGTWIYGLGGLAVVYTFFQIPLMLIVFLPAVEGLRPQWREASDSLGGTTSEYWRHVAAPVLWPSFLGSLLLLFANAFSAYATAAALISQGSPIVPLQIRGALSSEVALGNADVGKALALGMIVVVAIVMAVYSALLRRAGRWSR
jgi:putative spermidine/putrescine transport system permease protein